MRAVALLVVIASFAGCYKTARDPAVDKRLADIEAKLAEQDKAIAALETRTDSTELSLLAQQISELSQKVEALAETVAKAPAPRPKKRQPDPALVYAVPIGTAPVFGSPKAKVTMVMAFEFACPYCRRAWDTIDALRKKYGANLRVAYKQLIVHPTRATAPAFAACAAAKQSPAKWRTLADLMWQKAFDVNNFDPSNIEAIVKEAKLDMARYQADTGGPCVQEVADDQALFKRLAVSATPTFFINGRFFQGAQPQENFEALIDEELAKATEAEKKGTKPERYYDDVIVANGLTEVPAPSP